MDAATIPPWGMALWELFNTLSARRSTAFVGVEPIAVERIEAYARMTGLVLTPWEVDTLLAIDDAVREVAQAAAKAKKE